MKTLLQLVLSIVAVAQEANAQDVECVRERAAMVETIRAYARSDSGALGQQGRAPAAPRSARRPT
jgi:protein-L-isoaspartate(D-aspartate) O-methyltransferase